MDRVDIELWLCDHCGGHYAASGAGDLAASENRDIQHNVTGTRDECPYCRLMGVVRHRRRLSIAVSAVAEHVDLPGGNSRPEPSFVAALVAIDGKEVPTDRKVSW